MNFEELLHIRKVLLHTKERDELMLSRATEKGDMKIAAIAKRRIEDLETAIESINKCKI